MFWVTLLAAFGSVAIYVNRERHRVLIPWVVGVIAMVEMFFLFLMVIHNNPFETFLTTSPTAGEGLNPLLQNFYMAIHPPLLYLGFVGMTIPFAFGMAALATGQLDDAWLGAVRRWTMTAWLFLTVGLALGALWAYEELGWGGYWGWDPVENAGLLPWFTATAFLHSVMVQERRGMLKVWNVSLVIVTFFLTIFGTFMTRSGVVQSVHAFGEDRELALMFTVFMVVLLTVSFGLVVYRMPLLRARNELDSWMSREAAFMANNWVLLFAAFFVLFATMFPTLSEAVRGERLTIGPPFFNKWMTPVGLVLLFLTGIGPLLAWRKSSFANLRQSLLWPVAGAVVAGGGTTALGVPFWASGLCFALCGLVAGTILQEFWRGAAVRKRTTGTDLFTALVGLFARSRRRYAGYVIHLGIVLIFLGFAGGGFGREEQAKLNPGQQVEVAPFLVRYVALTVTDDGRKQAVTAEVEVLRDGKSLGKMYPAKWFFRNREEEPTTEIALLRGIAGDLYINLAAYQVDTQEATLEVKINPLVNWIWMGVGVMLIGTIIALLPERALAFADSRGAGRGGHDAPGADPRRDHRDGGAWRATRGVLTDGEHRAAVAGREAPAGRDRLHVRDVRPEAGRRVHVRDCGADARGNRAADHRRQDVRPDHRALRRQIRQPGSAGVAARQGIQPAGLVLSVCRGSCRHRDGRRDCGALVATDARRARGWQRGGRARHRARKTT